MPTAREDVITVLGDISSKDRHYEWFVSTGGEGNVAQELFRYWIRDAYAPHQRDFSKEFSQEEQDKLEMFTQFYEARLKQMPARFESLMTDVNWSSVCEYARILLDQLSQSA